MKQERMARFTPVQTPILERTNDENYQYREYPPSLDLASYVACYWTLDFNGKSIKPHRILPDGCVDLIFELNETTACRAFVAGLMTTYTALSFHTPQTSFGVRFFSDSVRALLQHPVSEFATNDVTLDNVWGRGSQEIIEKLVEASSVNDQIAYLERQLRERLQGKGYKPESLLEKSMYHLFSYRGVVSIRELAAIEHYSERTIRRAFKNELGIGPKEMIEMVRFQHLLQEFKESSGIRLVDIAGKYGYYDQAHFSNQFKRYYGVAPMVVLENKNKR